VEKDKKQVQNHKNNTINEIKKGLPTLNQNKLNMPQYSEKYLKEIEEVNKPKIILNLSENLPFEPISSTMSFTLESNTYVKVLREVERIKLGGEIEPELLKIEPTFDVQIGEILVTFIMQKD
jgi:hypothetical protein